VRFLSRDQHSIEQRAFVEQLSARINSLPPPMAFFVATQIVMHGSDHAEEIIQRLRRSLKHPDAVDYVDKLCKQLDFIKALRFWPHVKNDRALVSKLYETNGFFFSKGSRHPHKLLVVFTTMFNNFRISNALLYAMIKELDVSTLILKDCTYFNFLNGVSGLGTDISSITQAISSIASEHHISEIFVTGFSSGGYASLYATFLLPCAGYLGFSVQTDLSRQSTLFPGKYFKDEVRNKIDEKHLINLRALAESTKDRVPRQIVFGEKSAVDAAHAFNMAGVPNLKITKLNSGHQTVGALIEDRALLDWFRKLLFQTGDVICDF
jgi:hypothetical protein